MKKIADIYQNADIVLAWLGEEKDDSELAMQLLRRLEEMGKIIELKLIHEDAGSPEDCFELMEDQSLNPQRSALGKLFARDYWTRVWIVQEIVFAREAVLCCGGSRAGWNRSTRVIFVLEGLLPLCFLWNKRPLWTCVDLLTMQSFQQKRLIREHKRVIQDPAKIGFLDGIVFFRHLQATDPRDHIFATLSLVDHQGFEVDYAKDILTSYRDFVKFIIQRDRNLDILNACKHICLSKQDRFSQAMKGEHDKIGADLKVESTAYHNTTIPSDGTATKSHEASQVESEYTRVLKGLLDCEEYQEFPSWIPDLRYSGLLKHNEIYLLLRE